MLPVWIPKACLSLVFLSFFSCPSSFLSPTLRWQSQISVFFLLLLLVIFLFVVILLFSLLFSPQSFPPLPWHSPPYPFSSFCVSHIELWFLITSCTPSVRAFATLRPLMNFVFSFQLTEALSFLLSVCLSQKLILIDRSMYSFLPRGKIYPSPISFTLRSALDKSQQEQTEVYINDEWDIFIRVLNLSHVERRRPHWSLPAIRTSARKTH